MSKAQQDSDAVWASQNVYHYEPEQSDYAASSSTGWEDQTKDPLTACECRDLKPESILTLFILAHTSSANSCWHVD